MCLSDILFTLCWEIQVTISILELLGSKYIAWIRNICLCVRSIFDTDGMLLFLQQVQDPTISNSTCVRRDPRLLPSNSANCKDYSPHPTFVTAVANISYAHSTLTPVRMVMGVSPEEIKELSTSLLSNFVPQSAEFYTSEPVASVYYHV